MTHSPEITRLAIRIANLVSSTTEANERCRQAALEKNLPTILYAHLLLEVATLRGQFEQDSRSLDPVHSYAVPFADWA